MRKCEDHEEEALERISRGGVDAKDIAIVHALLSIAAAIRESKK